MSRFRFEVIDTQRSPELLREIAALFVREVTHRNEFDYVMHPDEVEGYLQHIDPVETYYAALDGNRLMGAACVTHRSDNGTAIGELAIVPEARGSGLGAAMVEHLAEQAIQKGDRWLHTYAMNAEFFGHLGFRRTIPYDGTVIAHVHDIIARGSAAGAAS